MNKYLKRIKDTVNKLNGTNPKKEYRLLDQIQEGTLLIRYQYELEKMDFSLDKESRGFQHIARYVRKMIKDTFGDWIFVSIDKYYLGAMWCSEKDKNECLEIFMVRTPRRQYRIGICAYRKGFESAIYYACMYGRKKLLEFHKPSTRGDVLSPVISKLPGFRKSEDNFYILTLPAPSSMDEFKKQIFPKFKAAYLALYQLDKQLDEQ